MSEHKMDTSLFDKAAEFALKAHSGVERRGKNTPYALHVFEAANIIASMTDDQELIAAGLLHDVVEDTDATVEEIEKEFGARVAKLVNGDTQPKFSGPRSETWQLSKQFAIDHLKSATLEEKMVAMGDKLSNMRAIARDFEEIGDKLWSKFNAPKPQLIEWYYRSLVEVLSDLKIYQPYREFAYRVDHVFSRAFKNL